MTNAKHFDAGVGNELTRAASSKEDPEFHWAWEALNDVIDPEIGLDIVSLGLVYDIHEELGTLLVTMTLTTPGCPASESLSAMAGEALARAGSRDIDSVVIQLVWDPPWNPSMIDEQASSVLGIHLRRHR